MNIYNKTYILENITEIPQEIEGGSGMEDIRYKYLWGISLLRGNIGVNTGKPM